MSENPKDYMRRIGISEHEQRRSEIRRHEQIKRTFCQRQAQIRLESLEKHRVFFYPGAGIDWEPLRRLTHLWNTFIFCDCGVSAEVVSDNLKSSGLQFEYIVPIDTDTITYLSQPVPESIMESNQQLFGGERVHPWGKYGRLIRSDDKNRRIIHFFYLGLEGLTTFWNLFIPVSIAPQVLYLSFGCDGTPLKDWNGPFGKVVQMCKTRPKYVTGRGGPDSKWPYHRLCQEFPSELNLYQADD